MCKTQHKKAGQDKHETNKELANQVCPKEGKHKNGLVC